jgi:flagellar basal-body rod modification protein FlgD
MINLLGANAAAAMQQSWSPRANSSNSTNNTNTNTDNSTDPAADTQDLFLKLLVAQLKTQDPTSPMDPTQMVGQMLSMNQLNELIQIRQLMQGATTPTTNQSTGA